MRSRRISFAACVVFAVDMVFLAGPAPCPAGDEGPLDQAAVGDVLTRALPLLQRGAAGSSEQRVCFTCHNQAVPVFALSEARKHGFDFDADVLKAQVRHTAEHLERGRENYLEGRGQGGRVIMAGYALWTLEAGDYEADEITDAVTGFLLDYQNDKDRWSHPGRRPPSSGSDFTATYVALRGLAVYGTGQQQERIRSRFEQVASWLLEERPLETEDRVFRLWSLPYVGADERQIAQARAALLGSQRDDGGWAQTEEMQSDAYATGTVLTVLLESGSTPEDPAVRRGIRYLLDTQLEDGSWHVVSRAEPFQSYYESGFPHGTDQFISIAASGWATLALLRTLDEPAEPPPSK